MPRTLTTIQQQDKDQDLAEKEKFSFTIRNACEDDISTIMETRSIGVHDVLTVVQTAMKLDPQAIKIAESEDEKGGGRFGLYGGCIKTSQPSCQRFWRVTTEVCGLALSCWNTTPLLWANSGQSLASNGSVVDSRDLNAMQKHFLVNDSFSVSPNSQ
ncbi:hypothetical protein TNCV_4633201 [Trichonephila clavipes]|nr:hypothetical protein TNCV_4633201 [Trichonephila clavipes]